MVPTELSTLMSLQAMMDLLFPELLQEEPMLMLLLEVMTKVKKLELPATTWSDDNNDNHKCKRTSGFWITIDLEAAATKSGTGFTIAEWHDDYEARTD